MSVAELNDRIHAIVEAHKRWNGTRPHPGLVLSMVRTKAADGGTRLLSIDEYEALFEVTPRTRKQARNRAVLRETGGGDFPSPGLTSRPEEGGHLAEDEFADQLGAPAPTDVERARRFSAMDREEQRAFLVGLQTGNYSLGERRQLLEIAGRLPPAGGRTTIDMSAAAAAGFGGEDIVDLFFTGTSQVVGGLTIGPAMLVYEEGKGVKQSVKQRSLRPLGQTQVTLGKAVAKGIETDVRAVISAAKGDPTALQENFGYVVLDLWGVGSLLRGAAGRSVAAAKAPGVVPKAKALATRPAPGTFALRKGGLEADVPLFENALARDVQLMVLKIRQRRLDERHNGIIDPQAGPASIHFRARARQQLAAAKEKVTEPVERLVGTEAKIGRELRAARQVDLQVAMQTVRELERVQGWAITSAAANAHIPLAKRKALSRGEQKAIQVLTTDDPNPLVVHREHHLRAIAQAEQLSQMFFGTPKHAGTIAANHRQHLADLAAAEKVLAHPKPRERFTDALRLVQRATAEQQRIKIAQLGLDPTTAERRIANYGAFLRGESILEGDVPTAIQSRVAQLEGAIKGKAKGEARLAAYNVGALRARVEKLRQLEADPTWENAARLGLVERGATGSPEQLIEAIGLPEKLKPIERERLVDTSSYLQVASAARRRAVSGNRQVFTTGIGPHGVSPPRNLPELEHMLAGDLLLIGDFRIDATGLAAESLARTVRVATLFDDYRRWWAAATDTRQSRFDRPIRDAREIPPELRDRLHKIEEGAFTADDAKQLADEDVDAILRHLYPDETEAIEGVRWVDERLFADLHRKDIAPNFWMHVATGINEPFRVGTLFIRAAYALNALSNAGMLIVQQGWMAPASVFRAVRATHTLGDEVTAMLDTLVGETRARAIAPNVGPVSAVSHTIARTWSMLVDRIFRRAALIYELGRKGYKTKEQIEGLIADQGRHKDLVEAKRRANKAMIEFDNLRWTERNILRHVLFLYPFVSRSVIWSLRAVVEHPGKAMTIAQIGREGDRHITEEYGEDVQAWVRHGGLFPIAHDAKGNPIAVNMASINTFSTLSEFAGLTSLFARDETDPYANFADFLSPVAGLGAHAALGIDRYGQPFSDGALLGAFKETVAGLPQARALKRAGQEEEPDKPLDLAAHRAGLPTAFIDAEHRAQTKLTFVPGFWPAYGPLLAGGLFPRSVNSDALQARYWENMPMEKRHKHEMELAYKAARVQAQVLGRRLPPEITDAIELAGAIELRRKQFAEDNGREASSLEKGLLLADTLHEQDVLSAAERDKWRERFEQAKPENINDLREDLMDRFAHRKQLTEWFADVRDVLSFERRLPADLRYLDREDLAAPAKVDVETARKYGRMYVAYLKKLDRVTEGIQDLPDEEQAARYAELRVFEEKHDKPVKIGQTVLPSPVRMLWARQSEEERRDHLARRATWSWDILSNLDKRLLGKPPDRRAAEGWETLGRFIADWKATQEPGERALPKGYEMQLAQHINKYLPGFLDDWKFSKRPLYRRLEGMTVVSKSPNRARWNELLTVVRGYHGVYLADKDSYTITAVRDGWRDYVNATLLPWLDENPSFKAELSMYDPDLLYELF